MFTYVIVLFFVNFPCKVENMISLWEISDECTRCHVEIGLSPYVCIQFSLQIWQLSICFAQFFPVMYCIPFCFKMQLTDKQTWLGCSDGCLFILIIAVLYCFLIL
jgi:hypothetical protein